MITYEYQCESCGRRFEFRQAITQKPIEECPECHGKLSPMVSGGSGFIIKGGSSERPTRNGNGCSFESSGKTCCGQTERCGKPPCGIRS
ncbi:MAG: zinc ribbon domain-containing protein [Acidobacteria bacterium]|nr:zinc ribbon domain-containing protein [Acidobacteriota bacterium]